MNNFLLCGCSPYCREETRMNKDLPKMPDGYYHLQASDGCYVLMDAIDMYAATAHFSQVGTSMKRLQSNGRHKRFGSPEEAAEYAHKHKLAGLNFDQEVSNE